MSERDFARDLAIAAPELAGLSPTELAQLAARYPSDPALRALLAGRPTHWSTVAAGEEGAERAAEEHYRKLRAHAEARYRGQ